MSVKDNVPGSGKIKKNISAIYFKGKHTVINFSQSFQPQGQNDVVKEQPSFKSDLERHPDFDRAMQRLKVHLMCRAFPFVKAEDKLGKLIEKVYFDEHLYEDDPRFMDVEVTGLIITTKKDVTGFYVIGKLTTVDEQVVNLKSPVISTIAVEGGYNYPLRVLADEHKDTCLLEADEFLKYKSNNPQMRIAI